MTRFKLQENMIRGLDLLLNLETHQLTSVISILQNAPIGFSHEWLKSRLFDSSFSEDDSDLLSRTVYGFGGVANYNGKETIHELVDGLSESYYQSRESNDSRSNLSDRILEIISICPALSQTNKILSLLSDKQYVYRESKVISDIRLLFDDDIENGSQNAVIIHDLRIEYQNKANDMKNIFISLDLKDLNALKNNIERAISKDSIIRKQNENINFIDILD